MQVQTASERLSSGQRIRKAADDSASLAIADHLRATTRLANIAIRNTNDAISVTSMASSGLSGITGILIRMAELAEQSANGTLTNTQRSALSLEFTALGSEITRIAQTTKFNDISLLSNSRSIVFQVGIDSSSLSRIAFSGASGTIENLKIGINDALTYSIIANDSISSQFAARTALDAVRNAIDLVANEQAGIGANESRLNKAVNILESLSTNSAEAEDKIRNADVAREISELVRNQILQNLQSFILSQANQEPRLALTLLQGV
jgi:flagellin